MFAEQRHRSNSILSNRTNSTWREDVFGKPRQPRGAMVFTGPDSLRMHRQKVLDPLYIGEHSTWTPERSSTTFYMTRAAPGTPHPRPKSCFSDSYGWGAWGETAKLCSWKDTSNHHPIKLRTFRQLLEHQATHTNQGAWYPGRDVGRGMSHYQTHGMTSQHTRQSSPLSAGITNQQLNLVEEADNSKSSTLSDVH